MAVDIEPLRKRKKSDLVGIGKRMLGRFLKEAGSRLKEAEGTTTRKKAAAKVAAARSAPGGIDYRGPTSTPIPKNSTSKGSSGAMDAATVFGKIITGGLQKGVSKVEKKSRRGQRP